MPEKDSATNIWREPLLVFAKVSCWVATPIVISLFIGRYLDTRFGTTPIIFIITTGSAFLISCFGVYKETICYMKTIGEKDDNI